MTLVQNEYHKRKETERANRANEEIKRSELAEAGRHNLATEYEATRSNMAKERETNRSNLAKEAETHRSNLASEQISRLEANSRALLNQSNAELNRSRTASEDVSRQRSQLQLDRENEVYGKVNNELAGTLEPIRQGVEILGSAMGAIGQGVKAYKGAFDIGNTDRYTY